MTRSHFARRAPVARYYCAEWMVSSVFISNLHIYKIESYVILHHQQRSRFLLSITQYLISCHISGLAYDTKIVINLSEFEVCVNVANTLYTQYLIKIDAFPVSRFATRNLLMWPFIYDKHMIDIGNEKKSNSIWRMSLLTRSLLTVVNHNANIVLVSPRGYTRV